MHLSSEITWSQGWSACSIIVVLKTTRFLNTFGIFWNKVVQIILHLLMEKNIKVICYHIQRFSLESLCLT